MKRTEKASVVTGRGNQAAANAERSAPSYPGLLSYSFSECSSYGSIWVSSGNCYCLGLRELGKLIQLLNFISFVSLFKAKQPIFQNPFVMDKKLKRVPRSPY